MAWKGKSGFADGNVCAGVGWSSAKARDGIRRGAGLRR